MHFAVKVTQALFDLPAGSVYNETLGGRRDC